MISVRPVGSWCKGILLINILRSNLPGTERSPVGIGPMQVSVIVVFDINRKNRIFRAPARLQNLAGLCGRMMTGQYAHNNGCGERQMGAKMRKASSGNGLMDDWFCPFIRGFSVEYANILPIAQLLLSLSPGAWYKDTFLHRLRYSEAISKTVALGKTLLRIGSKYSCTSPCAPCFYATTRCVPPAPTLFSRWLLMISMSPDAVENERLNYQLL